MITKPRLLPSNHSLFPPAAPSPGCSDLLRRGRRRCHWRPHSRAGRGRYDQQLRTDAAAVVSSATSSSVSGYGQRVPRWTPWCCCGSFVFVCSHLHFFADEPASRLSLCVIHDVSGFFWCDYCSQWYSGISGVPLGLNSPKAQTNVLQCGSNRFQYFWGAL